MKQATSSPTREAGLAPVVRLTGFAGLLLALFLLGLLLGTAVGPI
jgi:hypothetical protein